ncbi:mucin-2-like isoform X8 [Dermacentor silvarum]|uniref:mucin-2-like isoform X8 n=1 Tax=Dermacentor silvarum TaxID=543639 RepID=UPI0021012F0E|nr:mucin-2-like isoform X8 [Dermacentor silvarum]
MDTTTCLTSVVLLLAALSATTVGQTETATPAVTTTSTPVQKSTNDLLGTSSEESLLSQHGTTTTGLTEQTNDEASTLPPSSESSSGPQTNNDIFGTENEKLNDIEADKLAKTEVHEESESAVGAETPVVATNGTTTAVSTQVPMTEIHPSSADVFVTTGSTEHPVPFHAEGTTASSHMGDDGATGASSMVPVTTSNTLPPEAASAADDSGVTTDSSVNSETTNFAATATPHALRETTYPGSFATQQAQAVPFSTDQPDVLSESTSVPSISGPQSVESALETPTEGGYGVYPYYQPEISSPALATGPFHTPSLYSDPLNTNVPGYFNPTGTNGDIFPRFSVGFSRKRYSSAPEVVTEEQTLSPESVDDTTPSANTATSEQSHAYDEATVPPTYSTANESEATGSGVSLPASDADSTTEGITHTPHLGMITNLYSVDSTLLSTESPAQHESTDTQHQSELTSSTENQPDEATPSTDSTPATSINDGAPDVPTTESSVTHEPLINRTKIGRARTFEEADPGTNDVTGEAPREMAPTPYLESEENAAHESSSEAASPVTTVSESTASVSATEESTTVSPASVKLEPTTTAPAGTAPSDITTSDTTGSIDVTQTSSESATGASTESETSTAVITSTSPDSGTPLQETTTTQLTTPGGDTTSETSDSSVPQVPVEMTTSSREEATSSSVTDTATGRVTDSVTTAPTDTSTQSVSQSTEEPGTSTDSTMVASGDRSTQSPDIAVTQETTEVSTDTATTESHVSSPAATTQVEASTDASSGHPEIRTGGDFTTMTPTMTDGPTNEYPQHAEASLSTSGTTEIVQPVGREELTTEGESNMERTTSILSEGTTAPATEEVMTTAQQLQTTELPTYEVTTPSSPVISNEDGESTSSSVNAATTPTAVDREAEFTTLTTETAATPEAGSITPEAEGTTLIADTTTKPTTDTVTQASGTTASPVVETTAPPSADTTAPPAADTTAPPAAETAAPPAAETTAPPAAETTAPPAAEATAPPAAETTAPPASETTAPPASETTASAAAETTAAAAESTTQTAEIATQAAETTTALSAEPETEPAVGEVTTSPSAVEITTADVSNVITTTAVEATTPANAPSTEPPADFGAETEVTGGSSASRSPKQLSESTSASLPEWNTSPSTEHDHKHSFTTAPDLFSTTQSYTSWRQSTTHSATSEEPAGRDITEEAPWNTDITTSSSVQDWTASTETPAYTPGSPTSTEISVDASCNIVEGALPVSCLLPEELNQTVTVKFGDLNKTRAETFRAEARVWLLDYCRKNGIPLGEPTVVFLSGDRGMDLISFFVINRTRGSVVPSDTVVAVLNNMKLTFEDKLGTAITDVFYGLPVLHKKDVGVAGFLGSSLGLVYVIVGAALAALLLLALLVVIMVKCRTLSSNQYSPDSEKLTKDLQMRAEMGDLRPAEEILKEEAQLKDALNGNGTHINGDGWVVPYSQIVNERKPPADAQDTRL